MIDKGLVLKKSKRAPRLIDVGSWSDVLWLVKGLGRVSSRRRRCWVGRSGGGVVVRGYDDGSSVWLRPKIS